MAENAGEAQIRTYKLPASPVSPAKHTHGLAFKKPPIPSVAYIGLSSSIERHGTCLFNSAVLYHFPVFWTTGIKMTKIGLTALLAGFATLAQAVKLTNSDYDVVAGQSFTIKWADAEGAVSIRLKSGPANKLVTVEEIASQFEPMIQSKRLRGLTT